MFRFLVPIAVALMMVGCQSPTVQVAVDQTFSFDHVRTFAWHPSGNTLGGVWPSNQLRAAELLQTTIEAQLNRRSLLAAAEETRPDVWVAYHLGVKHGREVEKWGYRDQFGGKRPIPVEVRIYREGTLFVDLINHETGLIVWRGMASGTVDEDTPPETVRQRVITAIKKMFDRYPDG